MLTKKLVVVAPGANVELFHLHVGPLPTAKNYHLVFTNVTPLTI
jgi:hypothetical protein